MCVCVCVCVWKPSCRGPCAVGLIYVGPHMFIFWNKKTAWMRLRAIMRSIMAIIENATSFPSFHQAGSVVSGNTGSCLSCILS